MMNRVSHKGFTLIELIVAMSVMVILLSITIVGVRSMMQSSKASSTRVLLQSAESIFDEWRRSAGAAGRAPTQTWSQDLLPGSLNADDPNNYRQAKAVRLTRGMMFRMSQLPPIRKAIQAMPADRLWNFTAIANLAPSSADNLYDPNQLEALSSGRYYISFYNRPDNDYPAIAMPGSDTWPSFWLETGTQAPVLVDAWNNPVILFPSCGFMVGNFLYTSQGTYDIGRPNPHWNDSATYNEGGFVTHAGGDGIFRLYRCISTHAANDANAPNTGTGNWEQIPTRQFFASAGPDGVFFDPSKPETLQDNLYSYER